MNKVGILDHIKDIVDYFHGKIRDHSKVRVARIDGIIVEDIHKDLTAFIAVSPSSSHDSCKVHSYVNFSDRIFYDQVNNLHLNDILSVLSPNAAPNHSLNIYDSKGYCSEGIVKNDILDGNTIHVSFSI